MRHTSWLAITPAVPAIAPRTPPGAPLGTCGETRGARSTRSETRATTRATPAASMQAIQMLDAERYAAALVDAGVPPLADEPIGVAWARYHEDVDLQTAAAELGLPKEELVTRLRSTLDGLGRGYELLFVDDGSRDETPRLLRRLESEDPRIRVFEFTRNFGQAAALGLKDANLALLAQETLPGAASLKGFANAAIEIHGTGPGTNLLAGSGNVSLRDGRPFLHAHATFCDRQGSAVGGHLLRRVSAAFGAAGPQGATELGRAMAALSLAHVTVS